MIELIAFVYLMQFDGKKPKQRSVAKFLFKKADWGGSFDGLRLKYPQHYQMIRDRYVSSKGIRSLYEYNNDHRKYEEKLTPKQIKRIRKIYDKLPRDVVVLRGTKYCPDGILKLWDHQKSLSARASMSH